MSASDHKKINQRRANERKAPIYFASLLCFAASAPIPISAWGVVALSSTLELQVKAPVHAMQKLSKLGEPGEDFVGGVRFSMMDGLARVVCWITPEALDTIDGGNPQQDRIGSFERHRFKIEEVASKKYSTGERSPIVMTFDL